MMVSCWIVIRLGICIDIVEIWFGIFNGQISSNFDGVSAETHPYFRFCICQDFNQSWYMH